jgi:hypothetical protein
LYEQETDDFETLMSGINSLSIPQVDGQFDCLDDEMNDDKCSIAPPKPTLPRVSVSFLNGATITLIADSGAGRNVIQSQTYDKYFAKDFVLKPSNVKLISFNSNQPIETLGRFRTKVNILDCSGYADFYVVDTCGTHADNLLGFETLLAFDLIRMNPRIDNEIKTNPINLAIPIKKSTIPKQGNYVPLTEKDIRHKFPSLFEDRTGCMPNTEVNIELLPNAQPKQRAPYKVPFHIKQPCKDKLDDMVSMGIIEKVPPGERVSWCSPMHPVVKTKAKSKKKLHKVERNIQYQKKDIRITSDATDLNNFIKKQPRTMPCVVELKHALNNKAWFSKLDIKDAFNTIQKKRIRKEYLIYQK